MPQPQIDAPKALDPAIALRTQSRRDTLWMEARNSRVDLPDARCGLRAQLAGMSLIRATCWS